MKSLLLVAAVAAAAIATPGAAQTLYNNGPVVDGTGVSLLTAPANSYGATSNSASYSLADNFTVTGNDWNVSSIDFYAYQTQSGTGVFTFTSATWSVIAGTDINAGTTVASGTTLVTNAGLVGYRATSSDPTNQQRAIFRIDANMPDFTLTSGNYFLTWSLTGTGASGPFVPPVVGSLGTGNGLQAPIGGTFATYVDSGTGQAVDFPFTINGAVAAVPEAATWAMMMVGFGALGIAMRRRPRASARVTLA